METLTRRWRLIALVPLVAVAILSLGNRTGAVADQNKEVREAANEVGIVVQGGISHGQILRFNVARLAIVNPGPPNIELRVFDSNGNLVASHVFAFPNQNQNTGIQSSFFDLNADQIPSYVFDNSGRATVIGFANACGEIGDICNPQQGTITPDPDPPRRTCGFVISGKYSISAVARP